MVCRIEHTSPACLNKEENCQVKMVKCEDRVSFSVAGLLAYSQKPVKGISKNAGASSLVFEVLSKTNQKTDFYCWKNFSHILLGESSVVPVSWAPFIANLQQIGSLELNHIRNVIRYVKKQCCCFPFLEYIYYSNHAVTHTNLLFNVY